jgi:hypothetical protein
MDNDLGAVPQTGAEFLADDLPPVLERRIRNRYVADW